MACRRNGVRPAGFLLNSIMMRRIAPVAVVLLAVVSCGLTDVEGPRAVGYEGSFEAVAPDLVVTGDAAAVTQFGETQASVLLSGLEPDTEFRWFLRTGPCDGGGEPVVHPSVFPELSTDSTGDGTQEARWGGELEDDAEYSVDLFDGSVEDGERLACADLRQTI